MLQIGPTTITAVDVSNVALTSGYWTTIAQVNNFNASLECAEVDVTSLNSGLNREFIPGHLSATLTFSGNFVQTNDLDAGVDFVGSAGHITTYQARQMRCFRALIPLSGTVATNSTMYARWGIVGFFTNLTPTADNGDNAMTYDATIRVADSAIVDAAVA